MAVILDTGVVVAYLHPGDPLSERAVSMVEGILRGKHGPAHSSDWVLGEGLTLIRKRVRDRWVAERFVGFFHGWAATLKAPIQVLPTTPDLAEQAVETYFRYYDRALSFTDCVLIVLAKRLDAAVATFDSGFQGIVRTIDG